MPMLSYSHTAHMSYGMRRDNFDFPSLMTASWNVILWRKQECLAMEATVYTEYSFREVYENLYIFGY
jgi:hypothetical protein